MNHGDTENTEAKKKRCLIYEKSFTQRKEDNLGSSWFMVLILILADEFVFT